MSDQFHGDLVVSSAPHLVSPRDTTKVMALVVIALLPALVVGIVEFGFQAALLTLVCVISCVLFEFLFNLIMKREQTIGDLSAVVTGVLLAMNLPSTFPIYMAVIGCFFAIVVVKMLFGGIGQNVVNPAIAGRIFLLVAFAKAMTTWAPAAFQNPAAITSTPDAVTSATPLGQLAEGGSGAVVASNLDLFFGNVPGSLGEVSALALIIGGVFLIVTGVISFYIPLAFILTVFLLGCLTGGVNAGIFHILAGGVMLGAFFMATDYTTSPMLPLGQVIFGVGCGLLTMLIRIFGSYPEGVSFAILLMNILNPYIDRFAEKMHFKTRMMQREGA